MAPPAIWFKSAASAGTRYAAPVDGYNIEYCGAFIKGKMAEFAFVD